MANGIMMVIHLMQYRNLNLEGTLFTIVAMVAQRKSEQKWHITNIKH